MNNFFLFKYFVSIIIKLLQKDKFKNNRRSKKIMSKKKPSGGKKRKHRKKKKFEIKKFKELVKLGERKIKFLRKRGGKIKVVLLKSDYVNLVYEPGKIKKAKIIDVLETPSNKFLARSKVLVKGAIIQTDLGKARITNRPGQEGVINAILVEEGKK